MILRLLSLLLIYSLLDCIVFSNPNNIPTENSAVLIRDNVSYYISYTINGKSKKIKIPQKIIQLPKINLDNGYYVNATNFAKEVTVFTIHKNLYGFHLSSYEIYKGGSAGIAAGRDLFIIYDTKKNIVYNSNLNLGITKVRYKTFGCYSALNYNFFICDVNWDGYLDLGIQKESFECKERIVDGMVSMQGPIYSISKVDWYVFDTRLFKFERNENVSNNTHIKATQLPLIGIKKTPVDYVKEITATVK